MIGNRRWGVLGAFLLLLNCGSVLAGEVTFTAEVDRQQIGQDESLSLSISVGSEGGVNADQIGYEAPGFETVNEYSSNFVRSYYDGNSGRFGMTHTQKITKVLRPVRTGALTISKIRARIGGKSYTAPDITISVTSAGAGTAPPRNYGGGGVGLRGAGKHMPTREVTVRVEVDKDRAYKGEQLVVSYYLYRRARVYNIQVDKFPETKGFLREEMEMPVMGTRLDSEQVVLDGVPYERSLLARYAVYPLEQGKLKLDPMSLKYNYFPSNGAMDDDGDPFFQFFRQAQPRAGASRSEPVTVDVVALPSAGRPDSFSGGVGNFNVLAAVDKYEVKANEAVTLTVKVEGRGNLAAIGEPKTHWPENLELYDSKGKVNAGKGGVGSKIFEFLLIPRVVGKLTLPSLEFSFFDPVKKTYVVTHTDPIDLQVGPAAPGSPAYVPGKNAGASQSLGDSGAGGASSANDLRYLKAPGEMMGSGGVLKWLYLGCMGLSLGLIAWLGGGMAIGWVRKRVEKYRSVADQNSASRHEKVWKGLKAAAGNPGESEDPSKLGKNYEQLSGLIFDALDRAYGLGARSLPRSELRQALVVEREMAQPLWERIEPLLEFAELVRFTGSSGVVSRQAAHSELGKWVNEAEAIVRMLDRISNRKPGALGASVEK